VLWHKASWAEHFLRLVCESRQQMTALTTLARDVLHMHTSGLRGKVEQDTASAEADSVRMLEVGIASKQKLSL
jgi:hypothetical protein